MMYFDDIQIYEAALSMMEEIEAMAQWGNFERDKITKKTHTISLLPKGLAA